MPCVAIFDSVRVAVNAARRLTPAQRCDQQPDALLVSDGEQFAERYEQAPREVGPAPAQIGDGKADFFAPPETKAIEMHADIDDDVGDRRGDHGVEDISAGKDCRERREVDPHQQRKPPPRHSRIIAERDERPPEDAADGAGDEPGERIDGHRA
ncbi:hypothetical protein [Neorhizobium galegae]|uniref:hypothetical protein n=1 Tax=Neorhizobium galegae TaxID=399 RepID=UPI002102E20B|nr:hypothetical protein [Neorhizobium galegae]MCQ1833544.1 hypothetical protein [Neorhizobium galegae]